MYAAQPTKPTPPPLVVGIDFHDTLQPASAEVFVNAVRRANRLHAAAILVNLSSPGGMSVSADRMTAAMRSSQTPIIVWLGTGDSRVSGEALRLVAEADVVLMNKSSFLTPLWTETPRRQRPVDRSTGSQQLTVALADALRRHGRRLDAVDELSSGIHWFNAVDAQPMGLIDGTAEKQADVLRFLRDTGYRKNGIHQKVDLTHAHVEYDRPSPQTDLLLALMNPNLCVLLLTLGLLLIYLEINTPGVVVPGSAGVLLVLLAVYSLTRLPLTGTGVSLCVLAIALMVLEATTSRHGWFATAGVVCMVLGLGWLVNGPLPALQVSWGTAIGAGVGFGGVTAALMVLGLEARRSKVRTGSDAMLGWLAIAQTPLAPEGHILVRGELWRARLTSKDSAVAAGDHVKVLRADGMLLEVTAVPLASSLEQPGIGNA
ncbi:nodulation protein NfeD [Terriglobus sp. RCC_193]|uniref:NfeD family protein n=1 Tax=Terriglobus sp. RCC_193 TaxID=3239218 RepID=UPI003524B338